MTDFHDFSSFQVWVHNMVCSSFLRLHLEVSGLDTQGVQLIQLLKRYTFGLRIQVPAADSSNETRCKEDEADFASKMPCIWVDLFRIRSVIQRDSLKHSPCRER